MGDFDPTDPMDWVLLPAALLGTLGCAPARDPVTRCQQVEVFRLIEIVPGDRGWRSANQDSQRFVNLRQTADHPENGRRIRLKARVRCGGSGSGDLEGQTVYWFFTPGPANRTALPVNNNMHAGFGDNLEQTTNSQTDAEGWTPVVDFYISQYGGDRFTVRVTEQSSNQGGRETCAFEVWRKLWIEIEGMQRDGGGGTLLGQQPGASGGSSIGHGSTEELKNEIQTEVDSNRLFIRLVETGSDSSPHYNPLLDTAGASHLASRIAESTGIPSGVQAATAAAYLHLLLVDSLAGPSSETSDLFEQTNVRQEHNLGMQNISGIIRDDWFVNATVREDRAAGTQFVFATRPRPGERTDWERRFQLDYSRRPSLYLRVDLSGLSLDFTARVRIEITIRRCESVAGFATEISRRRGYAIIGKGTLERQLLHGMQPSAYMETILHEIGHVLGLTFQNRLDNTNNGNFEDVGRGRHCTSTLSGGGSCTMNETAGGVVFCDECRDALRGRDLSPRLPIITGGSGTGQGRGTNDEFDHNGPLTP